MNPRCQRQGPVRNLCMRAGLIAALFFWCALSQPASANDFWRFTNSDLMRLRNQNYQRLQTLEPQVQKSKKLASQTAQQIAVLRKEIQRLEKKSDFFGMKKRKIEKHEIQLQKLQARYQNELSDLGKLSKKYNGAKWFFQGANREIESRKKVRRNLIQKDIEIYETAELIEVYKNYKLAVQRNHAQYKYYKSKLDSRKDPTDKKAIQLKSIVSNIRKEAEETNFSYQIILAEISKRKEDRNLEKQQLSQFQTIIEQQSDFQEIQSKIWQEKKEGEELIKTSPLMKYQFDEYQENPEEQKIKEQRQFLFYLGVSLGLIFLIIYLVKKTVFH